MRSRARRLDFSDNKIQLPRQQLELAAVCLAEPFEEIDPVVFEITYLGLRVAWSRVADLHPYEPQDSPKFRAATAQGLAGVTHQR